MVSKRSPLLQRPFLIGLGIKQVLERAIITTNDEHAEAAKEVAGIR